MKLLLVLFCFVATSGGLFVYTNRFPFIQWKEPVVTKFQYEALLECRLAPERKFCVLISFYVFDKSANGGNRLSMVKRTHLRCSKSPKMYIIAEHEHISDLNYEEKSVLIQHNCTLSEDGETREYGFLRLLPIEKMEKGNLFNKGLPYPKPDFQKPKPVPQQNMEESPWYEIPF